MADITNDKGSLDVPPSKNPDTQNPPDAAEKKLDREAAESARRASDAEKRYDKDHDIFTK
jgi:hypothetical protein